LSSDWKDAAGRSLLPSQGFVANLKLLVTGDSSVAESELTPEDDPDSHRGFEVGSW
jgi:hypothetical protein